MTVDDCVTVDDDPLDHYAFKKVLKNGEVAGIGRLLFTCGLYVGLTPDSWRTRYCYETEWEAIAALSCWDGEGDPPGMWIKQKPEERLNPKWVEERSNHVR